MHRPRPVSSLSVPLLDCISHVAVNETEEKRAIFVMSRLHLRFNPSSSVSISQGDSVSLRPSPRTKVNESHPGDEVHSIPVATFPEWYTQGYTWKVAEPVYYAPKTSHTHSGRPASQWKRKAPPAAPYGARMIGSKVRDSPNSGAMFSPARGQKHSDYWSFLPTSTRKRHPYLVK